MKIAVYYVVRIYKQGNPRIDSGPHNSYMDATLARDENHRWNAKDFDIFESFIEGNLV